MRGINTAVVPLVCITRLLGGVLCQKSPTAETKLGAMQKERSPAMMTSLQTFEKVRMLACWHSLAAPMSALKMWLEWMQLRHATNAMYAQLRKMAYKKLTTTVEEDNSNREHFQEVCQREEKVMPPSIVPLYSYVFGCLAPYIH